MNKIISSVLCYYSGIKYLLFSLSSLLSFKYGTENLPRLGLCYTIIMKVFSSHYYYYYYNYDNLIQFETRETVKGDI